MIMYKVTKSGVYSKSIYKTTLKHVFYIFTDDLMMQRSRMEERSTPNHQWFENKQMAKDFHRELIRSPNL